jgi:general secretion pathway protein M
MKLTPLHHRLLALLLLAALLALFVAAVYFPLQRAHQHYDEAIEDFQDRTARYLRVAALKPQVEQNIAELKQRNAGRFYLKASAPALAAAEVQQLAQDVLDKHALKVESTQIVAHKDDPPRRKVTVNFRLRGKLEPIQQALHELESMTPYLFLDNVAIRSSVVRNFRPVPGIEPDVLLQFDLYGHALINKPAAPAAGARERKP